MKRTLRRILLTLYHTVSIVSLGIAFLVIFLWVRSYWIEDGKRFDAQVTKGKDGDSHLRFHQFISREGGVRWEARHYFVLMQVVIPLSDGVPIVEVDERESISAVWARHLDGQEVAARSFFIENGTDVKERQWQFLGFQYFASDRSEPTTPSFSNPHLQFRLFADYESILEVPYWFIFIVAAIWPGVWLLLLLRRVRQHKRMATGLCPKCKYDMRGSVIEKGKLNTCPECGSATRLK